MVTNPSDPNSAKAGGMQSMLARLKGMVQNLQSGASPEEEAVNDDDTVAQERSVVAMREFEAREIKKR